MSCLFPCHRTGSACQSVASLKLRHDGSGDGMGNRFTALVQVQLMADNIQHRRLRRAYGVTAAAQLKRRNPPPQPGRA
ncbi:hypothetical protein GCM10011513_37280 [Franconibacter daqui]|nr:hypothetical protein GCM10011513_37280 [Franconibacter daqui]